MARPRIDKTLEESITTKTFAPIDPSLLVTLPTEKATNFQKADFSKVPRTINPYMKQLFELYKKIALNTDNLIVHRILGMLITTRSNRQPLKISQLIEQIIFSKKVENYKEKKIVFVGKLLNDENLVEIPKMTVICLKISTTLKKRILKAGGEVYTLEKLFKVSPKLEDCVMVKSDRTKRKSYKYFGATGEKGSETYPRTISKGRGSGERRINNTREKSLY